MARSQGWLLPNLKPWREYRVISPTELADKTGIALSVISRLENQKIRAGVRTIDRLCTALGVSRQELLHVNPYGPKPEPVAA